MACDLWNITLSITWGLWNTPLSMVYGLLNLHSPFLHYKALLNVSSRQFVGQ
jgi:hypothetical protein